MDTKPYIIGAFDHGFEANRYFWSLSGTLGDTVRPIALMYQNPNGKYDEDVFFGKEVKLIQSNKKYPGNTGKHKDLFELIPKLNLDKNAWVIVTDVHDVVFQRRLREFPTDADILVCSEGKTFGEIEFWHDIFPKELYPWTAYNVGTFAMKYSVLMEFWSFLYDRWMKFFDWYKNTELPPLGNIDYFPFNSVFLNQKVKSDIAAFFNGYFDTLVFNQFLREGGHKFQEAPLLFGCYAYQKEVGHIVHRNGQLYTKDQELISIAHYNGSSKKHMKEEKCNS